MHIDDLTNLVINLCIKIHTRIGPGCFEKVYEEILFNKLIRSEIKVERQLLLPINYEELNIRRAYKLDLLVDDKLVVELKSIHPLPPVFYNQLQTHRLLTNLKHGLLLNFKVPLMKDGIHRVFNNKGREQIL
nr:GxxExxY protein [uncultured Lacibacter sp.]